MILYVALDKGACLIMKTLQNNFMWHHSMRNLSLMCTNHSAVRRAASRTPRLGSIAWCLPSCFPRRRTLPGPTAPPKQTAKVSVAARQYYRGDLKELKGFPQLQSHTPPFKLSRDWFMQRRNTHDCINYNTYIICSVFGMSFSLVTILLHSLNKKYKTFVVPTIDCHHCVMSRNIK